MSYVPLSRNDIIQWLSERRSQFDIVYVSGDTDSFAPPRSNDGIALLQDLLSLHVDIMFTTRTVFDETQLTAIETIASTLASEGHYLFGCVSVVQLTMPHLEPPPIPPSADRLKQICTFKERGLVSVLAARPFLPNVPPAETVQLIKSVRECVDIVLGEVWYSDTAGDLRQRVFQGRPPDNTPYIRGTMDFDINTAEWDIYEGTATRLAVEEYCLNEGIPFFMRSRPAVEWVRQNGPRGRSGTLGD